MSPLAPFETRINERRLLSFHRLLSSVMYRYPRMLEFLAKAGLAFLNRVGARKFYSFFAEGNKADLDIVADDIAFTAMSKGGELSGANGYEGYYNDYRGIPRNMEEMLLAIKCLVKILIGTTVPNKSVAKTRSVIKAGYDYEEIPIEGAGQYIFYSHEKQVIDTLDHLWG